MNQDFQIRHESKHYRPCNQYKHHFHRSHHRSLLEGWSVKAKMLFDGLGDLKVIHCAFKIKVHFTYILQVYILK